MASSSQASGSEATDAITAVSGAEEDELVADWRRAKRWVWFCVSKGGGGYVYVVTRTGHFGKK